MSDIDRPALQRAPALVAHRYHCGQYAGYGFTPPGRPQDTKWWCWAHYLHKERRAAQDEAGHVAERLAS